jgi:hypothetical protein
MKRSDWLLVLLLGFATVAVARADDSNFDLSGPPLDIRVTRNGETLPISKVPNLQPGDKLWLHPDFPLEQDARYLLVAAFLRGSTNPPPETWFSPAQTWVREIKEEGITITVPPDAQQALVFLAPETGGDFNTLRSNVRAKPGSFVRASADLNQASLDRSRINLYLDEVNKLSQSNPDALKTAAPILARSLDLKVNDACFQKPAAQQVGCLTANPDAMVLDDSNTQTMVSALTSGASADLVAQLSYTEQAGAGLYSPYVGAVVDVVRIMGSLHTAQYQYIPALVERKQEELLLKLNNPPSFKNPKSVLTVGLPAVLSSPIPTLRPVDPKQVFCLQSKTLVLPADGAPLVYSTTMGHDYVLHVPQKKGTALNLPAHPDALHGGFAVDTKTVQVASLDPEVTGVVHGIWGFQPFDGPSYQLESAHSVDWKIPDADKSALIVGREDKLDLEGSAAACVDKVSFQQKDGKVLEATYKVVKPNLIEATLPLKSANPGAVTLLVSQTGLASPDQIKVQTYSEGAHLDHFNFYAGDSTGKLQGERLDEVVKLELKNITFNPGPLKRQGNEDELTMTAGAGSAALKAGDSVNAEVLLNDGRKMTLPVTVQTGRPTVTLLSKNVDWGQAAPSPIHLTNQDELPQNSILTFVLQSKDAWPRQQKIEVATTDGAYDTTLSMEGGTLTLQDAKTVLATLNASKSFGPSAFGPMQFRPVDEDGTTGNWQPLGTLVRIPTLKEVQCPEDATKQCTLTGSNLFLLDSVSPTQDFKTSMPIPVGFSGSSVPVPRPSGTLLYIKLRDNPSAVNVVALPVVPE